MFNATCFNGTPKLGIAATVDPVDCGTDVIEQGMSWLTSQLQAHFSQTVTYYRGDDSVSVCATFGRKAFRLEDGEGNVRVEWTDRDFLIPASSLVLDGETVLPERGDLITVTTGGVERVYEVLAPGGEPPWRWSDNYRKVLRIHSKHIEDR